MTERSGKVQPGVSIIRITKIIGFYGKLTSDKNPRVRFEFKRVINKTHFSNVRDFVHFFFFFLTFQLIHRHTHCVFYYNSHEDTRWKTARRVLNNMDRNRETLDSSDFKKNLIFFTLKL